MHGENMRDKLNTEITRKQFLQYMAGAALMVFGLDNLVSLLTGHKVQKHIYLPGQNSQAIHGFGTSKFGV
jgi:hypothetical protein